MEEELLSPLDAVEVAAVFATVFFLSITETCGRLFTLRTSGSL